MKETLISPEAPPPCEGPKQPIVFAANESYAMPLATAIRSIVETHRGSWPLEFYLLSNSFREKTLRKVESSVPAGSAILNHIQVDLSAFNGFHSDLYQSALIFARLLIPKLFPESVQRVLYLDVDILVLEDLSPLWTADLDSAVLGAVVDSGIDRALKTDDPRVQDLPRVKQYFNSGVLMIDLPQWRRHEISDKAVCYLAQYPRSRFPDQDALNMACDGLWKDLGPRWNMQNHAETHLASIPEYQRPGIVHFVSALKPWNAEARSINAGFYDTIRARTRFARNRWTKAADLARGIWSQAKAALKAVSLFQS